MQCNSHTEIWRNFNVFSSSAGISVLMETFVDLTKFNATSYRAANWLYLGKTNGSRAYKNVKGKTQKGVYVQPLTKNYQSILLNGPLLGAKATPSIVSA